MRRMPTRRFLIFTALLVVVGTMAVYRFGLLPRPLFARVTFGSNHSQSVWFVAKGASLYLDRNPDDGVQPEEYLGQSRVDLPFEITAADGKTSYQNISVGLQLAPDALSDQLRQKLFFDADIRGTAQFRQTGLVEMSEQIQDAATLQVDSILQLRVPENGVPAQLMAGGESAEVRVEVITIHPDARAKISLDTKAALEHPSNPTSEMKVPVVEILFPFTNSTRVPAERFTLDELC